MPRAKTYQPHCPAYDCSGGYESRLHPVTADAVHITPDILALKETEDVIFRCNYCGFVWFQKSSFHKGFNPTPAGFYDSIHGRDKFVPAEDYKIRDENTSDYWNERRQRKLKRR
jgi:hypothetical protein